MNTSLVDGRPQDHVPVTDRALLYGDGLFETLVLRNRSAPLWELHWQRFNHGCRLLGLSCPDADELLAQCRQLCPPQGLSVVRFQLSRGSGGRAYWPDETAGTRLIVQARAWPKDLATARRQGLRACTADLRLASDSPLAGLKHCNRLEQVLAARECNARGCDEALLFNGHGLLVEAIASNLILDLDGTLVTPLSSAGVAGVGLQWLMNQSGSEIQQLSLDRDDLGSARSIMVVNSVAGPRPLRELDGRPLSTSAPCNQLQQLWIEQLW